jgi:hypothetical protein
MTLRTVAALIASITILSIIARKKQTQPAIIEEDSRYAIDELLLDQNQ